MKQGEVRVVVIVCFLLVSSTLGLSDECTVDLLVDGIDEANVDVSALRVNQGIFHARCSDSCILVVNNGVVREQCSVTKTEDDMSYAVYRCPNIATQFYIADLTASNCYLKYYTLCNDAASYNDDNLDDIVKDLLCGCNPEHLKYEVGSETCNTVFNPAKNLYCKLADKSYISLRLACTTRGAAPSRCVDDKELDNERFSCDESGIFCTSRGVPGTYLYNTVKCDGYPDCDDKSDEMNCPLDDGMYCDADSETPVDYLTNEFVCDGYADCTPNEQDESDERCYGSCEPVDGGDDKTAITADMICNGVIDCVNGRDEDNALCPDMVSCDGGTKWISRNHVCQGFNLCDDGLDADEARWNCSRYEICDSPIQTEIVQDKTVLCDTNIFCKSYLDVDRVRASNCAKCEKGGHNSPERCRDSDNGIICVLANSQVEEFIHNNRLCDGNMDCSNGEDEQSCTNGIFCDNHAQFLPWQLLCDDNSDCNDGFDENEHCQSNFFSLIRDNDPDFVSLMDYLNPSVRAWAEKHLQENLINHNIFACQETLFDMDGDKGEIIRRTIEENCISESKFSCDRVYDANFEASKRIMKSWLCDYSIPFLYCKAGTEFPADVEINSCRQSDLCYTQTMRCDDVDDCTDGNGPVDHTDEIGCAEMGLRCGGGTDKTVEDAYVCDGYDDCPSGVDEFICYFRHEELTSEKLCVSEGSKNYELYSRMKYEVEDTTTTVSLEKVSEQVGDSCDCSLLTGGKYLAAVCSTEPGAVDQPCKDSEVYNRNLCYSERNGTWYNDNYDNIDDSCKSLTQTLFGSSPGDDSKVHYQTFVKFPNNEAKEGGGDVYLGKSVFCKDPDLRKRKRCGVELENMCNLMNDCGDWSDELTEFCPANFECLDDGVVTRVISKSSICDGVSDCGNAQDECLDECNQDALTNTEQILGHDPGLLVIVWLFGTVSLVFNFYLIVSMSKSAFAILDKVPHRFIYRILVATIAFGDIMISIYLVFLASVDSFRPVKYCEIKEQWLTSYKCVIMGVLSTFGNHVSLFAMVTLSLFRLKTVVHYLWPRSVNRTKALRITSALVITILVVAMLLSVLPLAVTLQDYFVDRYYFPNRGTLQISTKTELMHTLTAYSTKAHPITPSIGDITNTSSWTLLLGRAEELFVGSKLLTGGKPYSFYSAYGVCLFNYLKSPRNNSFTYVITIIGVNLACFLAIISSYLLIWRVGTKSRSTERQLQKKLSIAVSLNIICRLPLFVLCLAHSIEAPSEEQHTERCDGTCLYYRYMSVFVIPINSVINPFINSEVPLMELLGLDRLCNRGVSEVAKPKDVVVTTNHTMLEADKKSNVLPTIMSSPLPEDDDRASNTDL